MLAKEFIARLKFMAPSIDLLIDSGLTVKDANNIIDKYIGAEKTSSQQVEYNNELLLLLDRFDLRKVEVLLITFNESVRQDLDFYYIGKVEVDHLVINKTTNEIQVLEFDDPRNHLWDCAKNGEKFLDALIKCVSFSNQCMFDDDLYNDSNAILKAAKEYSIVAGGEKYEEFYKMILGYF